MIVLKISRIKNFVKSLIVRSIKLYLQLELGVGAGADPFSSAPAPAKNDRLRPAPAPQHCLKHWETKNLGTELQGAVFKFNQQDRFKMFR